jgi:hypothetical protein
MALPRNDVPNDFSGHSMGALVPTQAIVVFSQGERIA